jgi:hypothetical protein
MKSEFRAILALAALSLLALPAAGTAEVRRIEIDVAGYLCGL